MSTDFPRVDRSVVVVQRLSEESDEKAIWLARLQRNAWRHWRCCGRLPTTMIRLAPDFREFLRLLNSRHVEFIGLDDLKINKRASGRHKDLNDLEQLP